MPFIFTPLLSWCYCLVVANCFAQCPNMIVLLLYGVFFSSKSPHESSVELHAGITPSLDRGFTAARNWSLSWDIQATISGDVAGYLYLRYLLRSQTTQGGDFSEMELTIVYYIAWLYNSLRLAKLRHAANALTYCANAAALLSTLFFTSILSVFTYSTLLSKLYPHKGVHVPIKEPICETRTRVAIPLPLHYTYYYFIHFLLIFVFLLRIVFYILSSSLWCPHKGFDLGTMATRANTSTTVLHILIYFIHHIKFILFLILVFFKIIKYFFIYTPLWSHFSPINSTPNYTAFKKTT